MLYTFPIIIIIGFPLKCCAFLFVCNHMILEDPINMIFRVFPCALICQALSQGFLSVFFNVYCISINLVHNLISVHISLCFSKCL